MKQFVKYFLHEADIDNGIVRVGIVKYSTEVTVEFQMNEYFTKSDVYNAIDSISYHDGVTNTADALQKMRSDMFNVDNVDRSDVENICIIMTDGTSGNFSGVKTEATQARGSGIYIYAIGIGVYN